MTAPEWLRCRPGSTRVAPVSLETGGAAGTMGLMTETEPQTSKWSLWSEGSILSIGSKGSVLSIGSVGSALSVGSVGSFMSAFSIGSAFSLLSALSSASRWSVMSHRTSGAVLADLNVPAPLRSRIGRRARAH
jgi:hypothetical protein